MSQEDDDGDQEMGQSLDEMAVTTNIDYELEDRLTKQLAANKARKAELEARLASMQRDIDERPSTTLEPGPPASEWWV